MVKNPPANAAVVTDLGSISGLGDPLEEGMASILAWRLSWKEEPGGIWSIASQRVGHDRSNLARTHALLKVLL